MFETLSFVRRTSQVGTRLSVFLFGKKVGEDAYGNRYYTMKRSPVGKAERRVVLYAAEPEASLIPPVWFGWLHHQTAQPLPASAEERFAWGQTHRPNLTGSSAAYHPSGLFSVAESGTVQSWLPTVTPQDGQN